MHFYQYGRPNFSVTTREGVRAAVRAELIRRNITSPHVVETLPDHLADVVAHRWGEKDGEIRIAESSYRDPDEPGSPELVGPYAMRKRDYAEYRDPAVPGSPWDIYPSTVALFALAMTKHGDDLVSYLDTFDKALAGY